LDWIGKGNNEKKDDNPRKKKCRKIAMII
jgi:hypothetical protein